VCLRLILPYVLTANANAKRGRGQTDGRTDERRRRIDEGDLRATRTTRRFPIPKCNFASFDLQHGKTSPNCERGRWTDADGRMIKPPDNVGVRPSEEGTVTPLDLHSDEPNRPTDRGPRPAATLAIRVKVVYIDQRLIRDWLVDSHGVGHVF